MKPLFTLVLFLTLFNPAFAQSNLKTECHNMDILVKRTVEALQKSSDSAYFSIIDTAALAGAMMESMGNDPSPDAVKTFTAMRSNPTLVRKLFVTAFGKLQTSIRNQLGSKSPAIEYAGYTIKQTAPEKNMKHYVLQVNVKAAGRNYHFEMYETENNGCFYIFEPVATVFNEGW